MTQHLLPVRRRGRYGYIDRNGHLVIDFTFRRAREFSAGLAFISDSGAKDAYIDLAGRIAVGPFAQGLFSYGNFSEDLALVMVCSPLEPEGWKWGHFGYIGRTPYADTHAEIRWHGVPVAYMSRETCAVPRFAIAPRLEGASDFSEGVAVVRAGKQCGYIDRSGNIAIGTKFDGAASFREGLAAARSGDRIGYIDHGGAYVIAPQFHNVQEFAEGLAAVSVGGKWGFVDRGGRVVIECGYDEVRPYGGGLAAVKMGSKWGYIDKSGALRIPPCFDSAERFCDGMARVRNGKKTGYVTPLGDLTIECRFDEAWDFAEGVAKVRLGKLFRKWGYIDKEGRYVWEPSR